MRRRLTRGKSRAPCCAANWRRRSRRHVHPARCVVHWAFATISSGGGLTFPPVPQTLELQAQLASAKDALARRENELAQALQTGAAASHHRWRDVCVAAFALLISSLPMPVEELHAMTTKMDHSRAQLRHQLQASQAQVEALNTQLRCDARGSAQPRVGRRMVAFKF